MYGIRQQYESGCFAIMVLEIGGAKKTDNLF